MTVFEKIEAQQKGLENTPAYYVGEQLKEICRRSPKAAELVLQDLDVKNMDLKSAERKIHDYADKNRGKSNTFCVPPDVAERILREFYGISEDVPESKPDIGRINLEDFL